MKVPKISVCVATYNQFASIEKCLRSILDQVVAAEVSVLVGDDASSDGTSTVIESLVEEYGGRLQHIPRKSNFGPYRNMRDLISRSNGDFVARVDGDDYWLPGKLAAQLEFLDQNPGCAAVYTNALLEDSSGSRTGIFNDVGDWCFGLVELLERGNFLCNSSVLFRAFGCGAWTETSSVQIDYRAHLWHARTRYMGHIGQPLVVYTVSSEQSMISTTGEQVRELYWEAIMSVPRELVTDLSFAYGITDFLRRVFFKSVRTLDFKLFRSWSSRVFDVSPYGKACTTLLLLMAISRIGMKLILGYFASFLHSQRVLYYR